MTLPTIHAALRAAFCVTMVAGVGLTMHDAATHSAGLGALALLAFLASCMGLVRS